MKKTILIITLSLFFLGCNMNPNKEERIQKLEATMHQALDKIDKLEVRVQTLEQKNEQLETKIVELEKNQN